MKEHLTNNSLGHLSKLCQVFRLMICVMLGDFLPFSSGIFSQNPVWCSDSNVAMKNPYPTKSPCVIWEVKRGFFLSQAQSMTSCFPIPFDLGGPNPPSAEVKGCAWPDEHAPPCISQNNFSIAAQEVPVSTGDYQTVKGILLFYSFGLYHFKRKTLKQKVRERN